MPFVHLIRRYKGQVPDSDSVVRHWNLSTQLDDIVRNYGGRWIKNHVPDEAMLENLLDWNNWLSERQNDIKHTVQSNRCYAFCNSIDHVNEILSRAYVKDPVVQLARVASSPDEIPMQNPRWQYRTYIKSMRIPSDNRVSLAQMLVKQEGQLEVSTSLRRWFEHGEGRMSREYFYVDHDDSSVLLMMNLICPGITGKTYRIVSVGK